MMEGRLLVKTQVQKRKTHNTQHSHDLGIALVIHHLLFYYTIPVIVICFLSSYAIFEYILTPNMCFELYSVRKTDLYS